MKMKKRMVFLACSHALLLAACASKPLSPVSGNYTAPRQPDAGHALVYIHYPQQEVATAFPVTISIDSHEIVAMASGTYTDIYVRPGRHTARSHWCSKWENGYCPGDLVADFDFLAGKTYYLKIDFQGHQKSFVTFIGYAPVMSGGYEGIEVSYDIQAQDPTITSAQHAIASKEIFE